MVTVNFTADETTYTKEASVEIKDLFKVIEPIETTDIATNPEIFKRVTQGKVLNYGKTMGMEWKVFYAEGEELFLISSDYIPASKLSSQRASLGFLDNGKYIIYWKNGEGYKVTSVNSQIINKFKYSKEPSITKSNRNYKMTASLLDASKWETFRDPDWVDENNIIGSPTIEMWMASWNKKYPSDMLYCNNANSDGYYVGTQNKPTTDLIDLSAKKGYQDALYFPHRDVYNNCSGYWLASPSVSMSYRNIIVTGDNGYMWYGNDSYDGNGYGVRPIVHLKAGVKIKPSGDNFILAVQ